MNRHFAGRWGWPIGFVLIATAAWLLGTIGQGDPLLGLPATRFLLDGITEVAGGIAAVLLTGRLVLGLTGSQATGFHRALVHLLLTFVVSFVVMKHFGFDLQAILATSAIVTAAVGFAMQPTLGTMIAGFTLHLDGIVRPGDGLMHNGDLLRVVSMNWRSVAAARSDGTTVIFPNSQISDRITEVLRAGTPLRVVTTFFAPLGVPPQRVSALVTEAVSDFALVDSSRPVAVGPRGAELAQAAVSYRLRYSILNPFERQEIEVELLRRLWYVCQRNEILLPVSRLFGEPRGVAYPTVERTTIDVWTRAALASGGAAALGMAPTAADDLLREGRLLLYSPDERLVLPEGTGDWRFLLVHGEAVDSHEYGLDAADPLRPTLPAWSLGPDARVRQVAERLARHIGPYAEIAVRRAARATGDLRELCEAVSQEIEDPRERSRFLSEVALPQTTPHTPGFVFRARRNAAGTLICHLALRAATEAAVIAIRPGLLEPERQAAE